MAIEVVSLVDVGVSLAEVAEAGPQLDVLGDHVAGVELDEYLWDFGYDVASSIDLAHIAIVEGDRSLKLLVCRLLVSEQEVEIESLERMSHSVGSPTPGLDVVSQRSSLNLAAVLEVQRRVVVGLGDIREQ